MRAVTQEELQLIAGGLVKKAPPKLREMLMKPPGGGGGGGTPGTWNTPVTVTAAGPGSVYGGHGFGGGTPGVPPSTGGHGGGGGGGTSTGHDSGSQAERDLTAGSNPDLRGAFFNIDVSFIHARESSQPLLVNVPRNNAGAVLGHSGITIGYGFDLGQTTDSELQQDVSNGIISQSLYNTVAPWVGMQGQAALTYAEQHSILGINLPTSDLQSLQYVSDVRLDSIVQQVSVNYYNATANNGLNPAFVNTLPGGVQTAIADVAVQYGPDLASGAPAFWSDITHYNWTAAESELQHFGDAFTTRRSLDAAQMQSGITQGALVNGHP